MVLKAIRASLIIVFITIAILYASLRIIDPLGAYTSVYNWHVLTGLWQADGNGYIYPSGKIYLRGYTATILRDGLRFVPDSSPISDCLIAFIGDSFTWGYGVSDENTFVNDIANKYSYRVWNVGHNGYNAEQVWASRQDYQADGYIYLHIWNDHQAPVEVSKQAGQPNIFSVYWTYLKLDIVSHYAKIAQAAPIGNAYKEAMQKLHEDDRVLIFAFEDKQYNQLGSQASALWESVILLSDDLYSHDVVSPTDPHPNRLGHQQIADAMLPIIDDWLVDIC